MSLLTACAPVILAAAALTAAWAGERWLHPRAASRLLLWLVLAASAAAGGWMMVFAGSWLTTGIGLDLGVPQITGFFASHGPAPWWLALASISLLLRAAGQVASLSLTLVRQHRAMRAEGAQTVVVVDDDAVVAMSVPGWRPRIVLSTGLMASSSEGELEVVVAHERSHLHNRHHAYLSTAVVAAALCPWLFPAQRELAYLTERWADEDAALAVGDRTVVAKAISRMALASLAPRPSLAFGGRHVLRRVQAMLAAPPCEANLTTSLAMASTGAAATGLTGTAMQVHHALHLF